jgi:hypothetical protein
MYICIYIYINIYIYIYIYIYMCVCKINCRRQIKFLSLWIILILCGTGGLPAPHCCCAPVGSRSPWGHSQVYIPSPPVHIHSLFCSFRSSFSFLPFSVTFSCHMHFSCSFPFYFPFLVLVCLHYSCSSRFILHSDLHVIC